VEIVTVSPSPGAEKFIGAMSTVGEQIGSLKPTDWSDGLYELSMRMKGNMKSSFVDSKHHVLDLAVVATSERAEGESTARAVYRASSAKQLLKMPLAAVYALMCLVCMVVFASVHYPLKYYPVVLKTVKAKAIEYQVAAKAKGAFGVVKGKLVEGYGTAAASSYGVAAAEKLSVASKHATAAYEVAAGSAIAAKASEAGSKLNENMRAELLKLRGADPNTLPVSMPTPPAGSSGASSSGSAP